MNENMVNMVMVTREEWEALVELRARVNVLSRMSREKEYIDREDLSYVFGFDCEEVE